MRSPIFFFFLRIRFFSPGPFHCLERPRDISSEYRFFLFFSCREIFDFFHERLFVRVPRQVIYANIVPIFHRENDNLSNTYARVCFLFFFSYLGRVSLRFSRFFFSFFMPSVVRTNNLHANIFEITINFGVSQGARSVRSD